MVINFSSMVAKVWAMSVLPVPVLVPGRRYWSAHLVKVVVLYLHWMSRIRSTSLQVTYYGNITLTITVPARQLVLRWDSSKARHKSYDSIMASGAWYLVMVTIAIVTRLVFLS